MLSIKFILDKEIRRIDIGEKGTISFAELKSTCERLYQGKLSIYILKYFDGEDWITCSSDEELHHAFQLAAESRILKFSITPTNKRNFLDSLEEAVKQFMAKNPAKSLWELIKKEEQERKDRKAQKLALKASSSPTVDSSMENGTQEVQETTDISATSISSLEESESKEETESSQESEFPNEVQSKIDDAEKVDAYPSYETETVAILETSQISQVDSITLVPEENTGLSTAETVEEVPEEMEDEASSQAKSVPDLSQSQLNPEKLELKLTQLEEMGFSNRDRNATCLIECNGDMMEAVKSLLSDV